MEKIIAAIKKCSTEIEIQKARSAGLLLKEQEKEASKKRLADLKAKLRAEQVEHLAGGKNVSNLDLEREIESAEKADIAATENAAIAADARKVIAGNIANLLAEIEKLQGDLQIAKLDTFENDFSTASKEVVAATIRLSDAQSQLYNAEKTKWDLILDNLSGKFKKAVRLYTDEYLPELHAGLDDIPLRVDPSQKQFNVVQANSNKEPVLMDSIFRKMEWTLKPAAAIAEVQADVFQDETNKRYLLKLLGELGSLVKNSVSTKNFSAPEWAFSGNSIWSKWTAADQTEPVRKFLRDLDA